MTKWIKIKDELPPIGKRMLFFLNYAESKVDYPMIHVKKMVIGKVTNNSDFILGDHWQYLKICATHWALVDFPR